MGGIFSFFQRIYYLRKRFNKQSIIIMYRPFEYYFVLAYIMGSLKFHWGL